MHIFHALLRTFILLTVEQTNRCNGNFGQRKDCMSAQWVERLWNRRVECWSSCSSVPSYACTAHSFAHLHCFGNKRVKFIQFQPNVERCVLRPEADSHWKRRLKTIAKVEVRYNRLNRITQALTGVKKERIAEQMENTTARQKAQWCEDWRKIFLDGWQSDDSDF